MRYRGQGHEIAVSPPLRDLTAADRATITTLFEKAYGKLYSRSIPGVDIEILSWVITVAAPAEGEPAVAMPLEPAVAKPLGLRPVLSGRPIRPKGRQTVPPRDAIRLELPGGGGYGDPRERDPKRVLDDLLDGMITADGAPRDYGVVVDKHGRIDLTETNRLRALRPPK
jgi:hypothetical protein